MDHSENGKPYAAFVGAVLIGGANFIAVSFSNQELPPFFGAALRFALAALLFLAYARAMQIPLARGRAAAGAAVYGLLGVGLTYAGLYYALVGLAAGTAAVIVAAAPLFTLGFAVLLGQERLSARGVVGGLLAMAGIAVLSWGTLVGASDWRYLAAALAGTAAASLSGVVAKALPDVHPVNMNAIGMAAGTVLLAAGSLANGEPWVLPRAMPTTLAVGWLVVFGSVGLFQLVLYVIRRWTASAAVYVTAGMPVVAVALGALMLGQPVTWQMLVGGAIVIAAVYVGAISRAGGPE